MSGAQKLPISPDLSIRETAALLRTTPQTIWAALKDGTLVGYSLTSRPGSAKRITRESIDALRAGKIGLQPHQTGCMGRPATRQAEGVS